MIGYNQHNSGYNKLFTQVYLRELSFEFSIGYLYREMLGKIVERFLIIAGNSKWTFLFKIDFIVLAVV